MAKATFAAPRVAEKQYAVALRKMAKVAASIILHHTEGHRIPFPDRLRKAINDYAEAIDPWANRLAAKMLSSVSASNKKAWEAASKGVGRDLRRELSEESIGLVVKQLQAEQVTLIKSIPLEAAERAQALALDAVMDGARAGEIATMIAETESISVNRATLIARTETSKAGAFLTQARAQSVGSEAYIWQTAEDGDVRETHRELNGKVFRWDSPPEIPGEGRHGPGEFPNCRCFALPVLSK